MSKLFDALTSVTPAPASSGKSEIDFGLMDSVFGHLDDGKRFVDANLDQAWLESIKFNISDDTEDPDKEKVSLEVM